MESKMSTTVSLDVRRKEILAISREMIAAQDEQAVISSLVGGLRAFIEYDTVAVYVLDESRQLLTPLLVQTPTVNQPNLSDWIIPAGTGIIGSVVVNGIAEVINHAHLDARTVYPAGANVHEEQLMVFPLKQADHTWGALVINRTNEIEFTEEEFNLAEFLASYASLALNNNKLINQLRERELTQEVTLSAIPDCIFRVSRLGDGFTFIQQNRSDVFLDERFVKTLQRELENYYDDVMTSRHTTQFEMRVDLSGEQGFFEVRLVFINRKECLAVARNITETRAAQRQLAQAEALKRIIVDTISDAVITVNRKGKILFVNDIAEKVFGYAKEELVGQPIDLIIPTYYRHVHEMAFQRYVKTGEKRLHSWIGLELPGLHKNQTEVPIEVSFGETRVDGEQFFSAIIRNITERRKKEEDIKSVSTRLSRLLQTMKAGVLVEDESRRIVLCNEEFCSMFQIPATPDQLIGTDCSDAAEQSKNSFKDPDQFVRNITKLLEDRVLAINNELEMVNGLVYERDYVPIFVDETYKGHMWVYRDITSRKRNEIELLNAKRETERSMKVKEDFLAKMSHELRTPINGVIGLSNLMIADSLDHKNTEYLKGIQSSAQHLLTLINDILDLSKIEAGKLKIANQPFALREHVLGIVNALMPVATQKRIQLAPAIDAQVSEVVKGDFVRIKQILMNLLSNALKFTHEGSVILACKQRLTEGRTWVEFVVSDTGIGIAPENMSKIFNRFDQAEEDTSLKYGGTGLGLNIVKELTELMGGEITVNSQLGKGSEFTVSLPLEPCDDKIIPESTDSFNPFSDLKPLMKGRVLVAEDNIINQMVVKNTLEKWGVSVTIANNGREALEKLHINDFDLVIMDIQMPEMDGIEATRRIRTEFEGPVSKIPILAMTASVLYDPHERATIAGMDDYLPKPFSVKEFYEKVSRMLKNANQNISLTQLDLTYLTSLAAGNEQFINEMLGLFTTQARQFVEQGKSHIDQNEFVQLARLAHSFKPQGGYIGAPDLSKIIASIEQEAKKGNKKEVTELMEEAQLLINSLVDEIENKSLTPTKNH